MEKNRDWKNYQSSQIILNSDNETIWNLYIDFNFLEDSIMGILNQGKNVFKEDYIEIEIIENKLIQLQGCKNINDIELQDIKHLKNHIEKFKKIL